MSREYKKIGKCCICGKLYFNYGCNPAPVVNDPSKRCCHKCDRAVVWSARAKDSAPTDENK